MKLHRPLRVVLAALLLFGALAPARAQEPQATIRVSVDVVRLSVAAVHTSGGRIPPLTAEDFRVYDNGVLQKVRFLHRPTNTPLRVALVLDHSPSVRPWWPTVHRTATSFLAKFSRSGCPLVLPFSDGIGPGRWGHYTANSWREFLTEAPKGDGTSLHDALVVALDQLDRGDEMASAASLPLRGAADPEDGAARAAGPGDADVLDREAAGGVPDDDPGGAADPGIAAARAADPNAVAAESDGGELASPLAADPSTISREELVADMRRVMAEILWDKAFTHLGNCDLRYTPARTRNDEATPASDEESIKAVLLVSDGADTTSVARAQDVINAARLASVPVFPVMVGAAKRDPELAALLAEIARATGGLVIEDASFLTLGNAYERILEYLRSSYVLVYNPDDPAEGVGLAPAPPAQSWHEVRVELRRPLLRAIVRPGYYR